MVRHRDVYRLVLSSLLAFALFIACSRITPAGFWRRYKPASITIKESDQGPRGGYSKIHWESKLNNTFITDEVLSYAKANGWRLAELPDTTGVSTWLANNSLALTDGEKGTVMTFETGWLTVDPESDTTTERNGFVILNTDGTSMWVYHVWGE